MAAVVTLRPVEGVRVDPGRISALYREFGPSGAETLVARAVSEMALLMSALIGQYNAADLPELGRSLRSLRRVAEHAGFLGLARAAAAVSDCTAEADGTALAATWDRLLRLAAEALASGGDLRGLSG